MSNAFHGVLDCTLRDGGYYTNWDFPDSLVDTYLTAVANNPIIHAVEVGYRAPASGYNGRFFHLPKTLLEKMKARIRPEQKLVVMLNEKQSTPELIPELIGDLQGVVDMIRFATPPTATKSAIALTDACVELGFEVGLNIMYMNKYIDQAQILAPLAEAKATAVALVDSYGACTPDQVKRTIAQACDVLPQPIGFHGHDNVGLSFANGIAAIEGGAVSLDTTVQGMGRGAGNLKTELMIAYLALCQGREADFGSLAKVVELFGLLQKEYEWGSNLAYMISGFAGLPQADVMDWFGTRRYSIGSIVESLRHQGSGAVDNRTFPALSDAPGLRDVKEKPVVIVGGGSTVHDHLDGLKKFVSVTGAAIVQSTTRHAELLAGIDVPQIYCLAGEEISRLSSAHKESILQDGNRFVAVQQPPRLENVVKGIDNVYQVAPWHDDLAHLGPVADEPPLGLALSVAQALNASHIYLIGFDGYKNATVADQQNARDVQSAMDLAVERLGASRISSLTPTLYTIPQASLYGLIQGK